MKHTAHSKAYSQFNPFVGSYDIFVDGVRIAKQCRRGNALELVSRYNSAPEPLGALQELTRYFSLVDEIADPHTYKMLSNADAAIDKATS